MKKPLADTLLEKKFNSLKDAETDLMGILSAARSGGLKKDAKDMKSNMLANGIEMRFKWKDGKKYRLFIEDEE